MYFRCVPKMLKCKVLVTVLILGCLVTVLILGCLFGYGQGRENQQQGARGLLSDTEIKLFGSRISNAETFGRILNPFLRPRVVGTPGHEEVREYIVNYMNQLKWLVELDTFTDRTPIGQKEFSNIIATLDPNSTRRLVLACHYDSKISDDKPFIGATDSAAPCAMMIQLADDLRKELQALRNQGSDLTLQFIFFDGEEAFVEWTNTDSIYGAKHLAAKWKKTPFPPGNRAGTTELDRIDMLVLLDLLGAKSPNFFSYSNATDNAYQRLATIEEKLREFEVIPQGVSKRNFFDRNVINAGIQDDHVPFVQPGVPILRITPSPFPSVWHTNRDDRNAIHFQTVESLGRVLRVFVAEYLGLQPLDRSPDSNPYYTKAMTQPPSPEVVQSTTRRTTSSTNRASNSISCAIVTLLWASWLLA